MTTDMRGEVTLHHPSVGVKIDTSFDGGVVVHFGDWPGYCHTTWFLDDEGTLDALIKNLLDAEMDYIRRTKGGEK